MREEIDGVARGARFTRWEREGEKNTGNLDIEDATVGSVMSRQVLKSMSSLPC